jgi:chemotaxis signal transduction protein
MIRKDLPWVITKLGSTLFGLNCSAVREMVMMPEVCAVPGVPDYLAGVINLRGRVTPLVDLRKRLGMRSTGEEIEDLCKLLEQRAQDHQRWLNELEASVNERRAFTLARDPHKCAFGKWYDTYTTDNLLVAGFLKKFDAPHKRIHAMADEVDELIKSGRSEEAAELIEKGKNGNLAVIVKLFSELQQTIRDNRRDIAVVLNGTAGAFALMVDSVASVERLAEVDTEELAAAGVKVPDNLVHSVAKRAKGEGMVLVLDTDSVLDPNVQSGIVQS